MMSLIMLISYDLSEPIIIEAMDQIQRKLQMLKALKLEISVESNVFKKFKK